MSPTAPTDLDTAFSALADATRRAVIRELLRAPLRAGELARRVEMSPPALTRHLRVLREAGLIVETGVEHDARVRIYKVDLEAFAPARHWLDEVEAYWHEQLAAFKEYAEKSRAPGEDQRHDGLSSRPRRRGSAAPGAGDTRRSERGRPVAAGRRAARKGRSEP